MKSRRWVLVLAVVLSTLLFGWYGAWRYTRANEKIRTVILKKMEPFISSSSNIGSLEVGIRSVQLQDVALVAKDSSYTLAVDEIRIGYNLFKLIAYRFVPSRVANELVMKNPVLTVRERHNSGSGDKAPASSGLIDSGKWVNELETIQRISVTNARIVIENNAGRKLVAGHSLQGYVRTQKPDSAVLSLTGAVFSSTENNLHIEGAVDLMRAVPHVIHIKTDNIVPEGNLDVILPPYLTVLHGEVHGELLFGESVEPRGTIAVRNGDLCFKGANLMFRGVDINGDFMGDSVAVRGSVEDFNGSRLDVAGKVRNIFSPDWDLVFSCPDFDLPAFFTYAVPGSNYGVKGSAGYYVRLLGSLSNPVLDGRLESKNVELYGIGLNQYGMSISMEDSVLSLNGRGRREKELDLSLQGMIDLASDQYDSDLGITVKGSLLPLLNPLICSRLKSFDGVLEARINGPLYNLEGSVGGRIRTLSTEGDSLFVLPDLTYRNDSLSVDISSTGDFYITGHVYRPFRENPDWQLYSSDITDLVYPMVPAALRKFVKDIDVGMRFEAGRNNWFIYADGRSASRRGDRRFFSLNVMPAEEQGQNSIEIESSIFAVDEDPTMVSAAVHIYDDSVAFDNILIGRNFYGFCVIPMDRSGPARVMLRLNNADVSGLGRYVANPPPLKGMVSAAFDMNGPLTDPDIRFSLDFEDGAMNSVGPLRGRVVSSWTGGMFDSLNVFLNRRSKRIVYGSAQSSKQGRLTGTVQTDTLYLTEIGKALRSSGSLTGLGMVQAIISGTTRMPVVSGTASIFDGSLGPVTYNTLRASFRDTLSALPELGKRHVLITRGQVERNDACLIDFHGYIPHTSTGDIDLSVEASGNVLGMLQEVSPLFTESYGQGNVHMRFAGKPGSLVLGSAGIAVERGAMKLGAIFPSLKNITVKGELEPGSRFFHIQEFSALVHNRPLLIQNVYDSMTLPGLDITALGFSLGNIHIHTEKPVKMVLPGLMEKGAEGGVRFSGYENGSFAIGGPPGNPRVKGTLELFDFRFTFPFIKQDKGSVDTITPLLEKVSWNLHVVPKKDVHYTRDIKTALGNVYADLKLTDNAGGVFVRGTPESGDMAVWGNVRSTEGSLEVLNHFFRPEQITFDLPRKTREPILSGRAYTTITDSLGMPSTVWITVTAEDRETGLETSGGLWENIRFKFATDNPNLGRNEADLMAALGYSTENMRDRAYDALGTQVENFIFRPIFRPIERSMRRHLGLDVVRFSSMFSRNLFQIRTMEMPQFDYKFLLRSTRWTLGKYLGPGIFITYTGQVQNEQYYHGYLNRGLGFKHALSLEFTVRPDIFLEFEYMYDSQLLSDRREDKKIWLRHIFPF